LKFGQFSLDVRPPKSFLIAAVIWRPHYKYSDLHQWKQYCWNKAYTLKVSGKYHAKEKNNSHMTAVTDSSKTATNSVCLPNFNLVEIVCTEKKNTEAGEDLGT